MSRACVIQNARAGRLGEGLPLKKGVLKGEHNKERSVSGLYLLNSRRVLSVR